VSFRRTATGGFVTRVSEARSFAGRVVKLQRRTGAGRWLTLKQIRLGRRSGAVFAATLPRGSSTLRIAMSVNRLVRATSPASAARSPSAAADCGQVASRVLLCLGFLLARCA
jgi:hypothetical protein